MLPTPYLCLHRTIREDFWTPLLDVTGDRIAFTEIAVLALAVTVWRLADWLRAC